MNYEQFYSSVNHALPHLEPELKNALVGPHHSRKLAASSDLSFKVRPRTNISHPLIRNRQVSLIYAIVGDLLKGVSGDFYQPNKR